MLRPGNSGPAAGALEALGRLVARLRREWPGLAILVRADSAYAREDLLAWCEDNGVDYVIGVARNSRLTGRIGPELARAAAASSGSAASALVSLAEAREKALANRKLAREGGDPLAEKRRMQGVPSFVVTSLPRTVSARIVYERVYCPRGDMENAIKEQQLDLFSDRTSASRFPANQLRLLFAALRRALRGTRLARATAGTLRLKLRAGQRSRCGGSRWPWTPHIPTPPPSPGSTPDGRDRALGPTCRASPKHTLSLSLPGPVPPEVTIRESAPPLIAVRALADALSNHSACFADPASPRNRPNPTSALLPRPRYDAV